MQSDEKGFTLLESLFVLSIFLLITSISILLLKPHYFHLNHYSFLNQLKADLYYAQQYAVTTETVVSVNIIPSQKVYYVKKMDGTVLLERTYSKEVRITAGTLPLFFRFNPNGNISEFGSIYINIHDSHFRFTFLIGKGRFYVIRI